MSRKKRFYKEEKEVQTEKVEESHSEKREQKKTSKSDLIDFFKKNKKTIGIVFVILLFLIPVYLSANLRLYPTHLPVTYDWAQESVENFYRTNIRDDIENKYAYLPAANREEIIERELNRVFVEQKDEVEAQVEEVSENIKQSFKDEDGYTYLIAIDPWMHYQYTNLFKQSFMTGLMMKKKNVGQRQQ